MIDAFARRTAGWQVNRTAHAGFAPDALEQAIHARKPARSSGASLVHRSDRDARYLSIEYSERLAEAGIEPSVGSVGDGCNNALVETINGLYSAPSATSRPQRPKQITMPPAKTPIWLHDSNQTAAEKPGAVQPQVRCRDSDQPRPRHVAMLTYGADGALVQTYVNDRYRFGNFPFGICLHGARTGSLGIALPTGTGYRR